MFSYDVSLLSTIASASASFVAILGGFIASRLIAINSERTSLKSRLQEVTGQLMYYRGVRNLIHKNLNEEDAIRYIYDHMTEMSEGETLEDIYEERELQLIDIIDLEPLWERAQKIKDSFDGYLQNENCELNSDMIPLPLAEEYREDMFAYEFCKIYAGWGFTDFDFNETPFRERGEWYERDKQEALRHTTQIMVLEQQQELYSSGLNSLKKPQGMTAGIILFGLFSLFNIIFPLVLSLFELSGQSAVIATTTSILFLAIGLAATFAYLVQMLKWKSIDSL